MTEFTKGNYSISATASIIANQSDERDNSLSSGEILVTLIVDVNGYCKVDLKDVYAVGKAFGSTRQRFNPSGRKYSLNCHIDDDKIDLKDYYPTCMGFGKSW